MSQDLLSVEQVAALLGLHVRTIRNHVREGRLKAVRIGKQYRIAREDLAAFTGRPVPAPEPVARERHSEASSVVQIEAISPDDASRVTTLLMAALKTERHGDTPMRIDTVYDDVRGRLKVILTGSVPTTAALLRLIHALAEPAA